jgi:type II secretory pathway predicted ATPase ExeA
LSAELSQSSRETSFSDETCDPNRFVLSAHRATVAALIDGVIQGQPFLALTGPRGSGKTAVASAIRDELIHRSVRVLEVRRNDGADISLRTIASQVLGQPESEMNDDDIERLFDVMTMREVLDQKFALIIDDAECLQADALGYMRLLAILARDAMPQIVFVGGPEFWDTEYAVRSDLQALITARWELPRLSPEESRAFIEQSVAPSSYSAEVVFAEGGVEALVRHGDGLCGRMVSLVSLARALRVGTHDHWLTPALIDLAAEKLDADGSADDSDGGPPALAAPASSERDADGVLAEDLIDTRPSGWLRRVARMAGAAAVLICVGTVTTWQVMVHLHRTDAQATVLADHATTDAPAGIRLETVAAPVAVVVMADASQPDVGRPDVAPAAPEPSSPQTVPVQGADAVEPTTQGDVTSAAQTPAPQDDPAAPAVTDAAGPAATVTPEPVPPAAPDASAPVAATSDPAAVPAVVPAAPTATEATETAPRTEPPEASPAAARESSAPVAATPDSPAAPDAAAPSAPAATDAAVTAPRSEPPEVAPATPAIVQPAQTETPEVATPAAVAAPPAAVAPQAETASRSDPPPPRPAASADLTLLLSRGDAMVALGDVVAARLLYQRAAALGSARAATAVGKTYDPRFLASIHASGIAADRTVAAAWYRKGAASGDTEGADRLAGLTAPSRR